MQFICFGNAKRQIVTFHHYQVKWLRSWSKELGPGLVQRPPYQISTGGAAIQAWGSWTGLDEITLQPHDAITIGISTTSSDSRLKYYVVTLLHHTLFAGEMYRMGAISTVLPGKQTVARAWYYGLRMIAHYVDLQSMVRVHVLSVKAWQGWVKGRHHETFFDLAELVTWDQRQRIRALSVTQQQIKTMPSTGLSLRNRFKDANRAAKEFALLKKPVAIEQELQEQDQRYGQYAPMAAARIRFLLETQDHFLHGQKATGKEQRQKAREEKKHLYLEIGVTGHEGGHQWTSKGRGLQCRNCKKQIHQRMPMAVLKTAKDEACEVASGIPLTAGEAPQESKQDYITRILAENSVDGHLFTLQANYIVCQKCSARVLRNSAREKIQQLHEGPCWYGPWQPHPRWTGSPPHTPCGGKETKCTASTATATPC